MVLTLLGMQGFLSEVTPARIKLGNWEQRTPIEIEVVRADRSATWIQGSYQTVKDGRAQGVVKSPDGSSFLVVDRYQPVSAGWIIDRSVRVITAGSDKAFSSRFSLAKTTPSRFRDHEFFIPGVWYRDNRAVPKEALAADLDAEGVLVREDRLPLPVAMVRNPVDGSELALTHMDPDGSAFAGEDHRPRIVDGRMRFGSIGFLNRGKLAVAFQYPGTEGDRTYIGGPGKAWALRSHPIEVGLEQRYRLRLSIGRSNRFADAVQTAWRQAFQDADPKVPRANQTTGYRESMSLLAKYGARYNGVPSMPFQVRVPTGEVIDTSSQMGFVGKALSAAALLLRSSMETGNASLRVQAEDLINFWVKNAMNPSGVPKTWYDIQKDGTVTWRTEPTHLRIAADGMHGVLDAWRIGKRPEWLAFARKFGDFLVAKQEKDGSLSGLWNWDGTSNKPYKNVSYHVVPFLAALHQATGDPRYRESAIRIGEFALESVDNEYAYAGGAPDNPNVTDKEAGILAMQAFLALHALTGEEKWIAPAARAGTYCETWTYAWNVPLPKDDPLVVYPRNRTTLGLSVIATGHSGADNCMALAVYDYYRLWLLTKDPHFLRFSKFLADSTKQMMDWDGSLGYSHRGLLTEVLTLSPPHGHGLHGWLPWLSVAILQPMVKMKEAFGTYEIEEIEKLPLLERLDRLAKTPL